jgi:predicted ester cyclase
MKKTSVLAALMALAFCVITVGKAVADEAKNEAIIERNLEEIWNQGNLSVIDEIISSHYVRHQPDGTKVRGRDGYRRHVLDYRNAIPDIYINMDMMVTEGDCVVVRYSYTGTHTSGTKVSGTSILIHRLAGGKMVECVHEANFLPYLQQLGYKLVPPE